MSQRIVVTIPRSGLSEGKTAVKVEANGFQGVGCSAATRLFQQALGQVRAEEAKAEMFYTEEQVEKVHEGGHGAG